MSLEEQCDLKSEPKRKRSESPVSMKHEHFSDESNGEEYKNKRVKSEREASPTPSHMSWSVDPQTNLKGRESFPSCSSVKSERAASPTYSYMSAKTDWSMDPPTNFKGVQAFPLDTSHQSAWSDWTIEPQKKFKGEETIPLDSRLLKEHHLRCPVCKSILKDPVSIPCGHSYCRYCINTFWDNCVEDYVCPQCGKGTKTRPVLNTNAALAEVVKNLQQAGFSPALPPFSYAGPEDAACDLCSEQKLKAVKSCSTCGVFLCETHVSHHYIIPALQKHTLCEVIGGMENRLTPQHWTTDNIFSNSICGQQDHTDHEIKTQDIIKEETDSCFSESLLNISMPETKSPKEAAEITSSETDANIDIIDVRSIALMCSTLQQEVSGLKKSLSELKEKNTNKNKHYDEYKEDFYEEEDDEDCSKKDSDEENDDEEGYKDSYDEEEGYEDVYDYEKDYEEEEEVGSDEEEDEDEKEDSYDDEDENFDGYDLEDIEDDKSYKDYDEDNSEDEDDYGI
ncbi:E3 ubiquitin/ISG15 ligase TRIM25 isoform X2 [Myxocyprinus asiaticus]|uniref:E3 ubiquitin/ISG15 ligase TRIM25 isoform X2 n=1 Tax=Myxocyprinus asiaticus TaxID=70543 RepID=UPI0022232A5D|nr:E3 ubiquitin/ISG15 ligase TRIM25 isoform X2 [Myxocyprinus asiaticus]